MYLDLVDFIFEMAFFSKKNSSFLTNQTTPSKPASKKEWLDAFSKFKQSKHPFQGSYAC
jgi:hypothetical protein